MSRKPLIAINGDFRGERSEKGLSALSWCNAGYYDSVVAAGGIPVMVPPLSDDDDIRQLLSDVDGLVLSGCNFDLDPVRLGFDKHPTTVPMPIRREDFDRRLCTIAIEMRIPILAIGSGLQLMNVMCGGTLFQNVVEDVPKALHHRDNVEVSLRHLLEIVPGTRMDSIYGPGEIRVNSQHHMAIDQVAPDFRVSATAPDGVVEAIEAIEEDWFCVGVQWHPESMTASALDMQVFEHLLEACQNSTRAVLPMSGRRAA
ncbi:gamma-glutamyl-gamma-aminobutyrate hydrolase family protein [Calycomorphotria hydatis]|uniref:Glutamine amidotransferase n=1 Tax=Calycomorphotria hydatis TaxID=2528027 RepID=A0A517TA97_9PLAN|nr:gamma-glutamyl-gamma-aminobutyrate hydrolase family protein [Calycomorphotria hydatis]QDT65294.1 Putative glutamine amidotransferase [Calycomorphotria hydatis]